MDEEESPKNKSTPTLTNLDRAPMDFSEGVEQQYTFQRKLSSCAHF
jgi:hypothetical protein